MGSVFIFALLFVLAAGHAPCVDYSAVCVPAQGLKRGCHCALIRPGQEVSVRHNLRQMFGRNKRDVYDDIRLHILQQSGVNELNRVFSPQQDKVVPVDNNVFGKINTEVHVSLMTVPRALVHEVIDMQGEWLSHAARQRLLNCGQAMCEVVGDVTELSVPSSPTRQDRKFRVNRAVRYDLDGEETLIAFASATSDFFLNKALIYWEEEKCKRKWYGKKKCWSETRHREELREFDDVTKKNWMEHVNGHMVGNFRTHNANLLK
uniref:NTR domain-containing protein n=1 Tax=Steinernema glaseri TaxID=37863 RepID=A0A1I7ZJJ1_9BILA